MKNPRNEFYTQPHLPKDAPGVPKRFGATQLENGFEHPPKGYGEVAFYWWVGEPLDKERILWQLDKLAGGGITGLQVNYAHSAKGGTAWGKSIPSDPPVFSEPWWELYGWFLKEAAARGMSVSLSDYTLGIGQGFFLDDAIAESPELTGSELNYDTFQFYSDSKTPVAHPFEGEFLSASAWREKDGKPDFTSAISFTTLSAFSTQLPEGNWLITLVTRKRIAQSYDPMHPRSGAVFVDQFFEEFSRRFPGADSESINFFFSDELEFNLTGDLWNDFFAEEFQRIKGYPLLPELPLLACPGHPRSPKIRLDYRDVMNQLSEKYFFKPVWLWHQERGKIYGCDHGGRGQDVTEFGDYFRAMRWYQGPGCDQPRLGSSTVKNKVASSIAHLYERPRVWLEGFYGSGWGTTSGQVYDALIRNMTMGHNLLSLHGLYYTTLGGWWEWAPPCNHWRMPYWNHFRQFLKANERLSFLMSQGVHVADVAIYYPVADVEAFGGSSSRKNNRSVETAFSFAESLFDKGVDFDFIDYQSIEEGVSENGALHIAGESYKIVVLPALRAIRFSTLTALKKFAEAGGTVVACGALPFASDRTGANDLVLDDLCKSMIGISVPDVPTGVELLAKRVGRDFKPDESRTDKVWVHHRKIDNRDLYLIYGASKGSLSTFRATGSATLWDPWTGKSLPLTTVQNESISTVTMPLESYEATVIVFDGDATPVTNISTPQTTLINNREKGDNEKKCQLNLDGLWESKLIPVLDNRYGDFRMPPSHEFIGAEARSFRYLTVATTKNNIVSANNSKEATPAGWNGVLFDDADWHCTASGFAIQFYATGPMSETQARELRNALKSSENFDLALQTKTVQAGTNTALGLLPVEFSWQYGRQGDPGPQGYHGLKGEVSDHLIACGVSFDTSALPREKSEENPRRLESVERALAESEIADRSKLITMISCFLLSEDAKVFVCASGTEPVEVLVDGVSMSLKNGSQVNITKGIHRVLCTWRIPSLGTWYLSKNDPNAIKPVPFLATSWYSDKGRIPFHPFAPRSDVQTLLRFWGAPGTTEICFHLFGEPNVWVDGKPQSVQTAAKNHEGVPGFFVKVSEPSSRTPFIAMSVSTPDGYSGGGAVSGPIKIKTAEGLISLGDWATEGALENYSGGLEYKKSFEWSENSNCEATLDLGEVSSSAEVFINGEAAGIRVAAPFRFSVGNFLRRGKNEVRVIVYNSLANHYRENPTHYRTKEKSGIMGPVSIAW